MEKIQRRGHKGDKAGKKTTVPSRISGVFMGQKKSVRNDKTKVWNRAASIDYRGLPCEMELYFTENKKTLQAE